MDAPTQDRPAITSDDLELLSLLARGMSGAQLSAALRVNPRTVQRRIQRVRNHFGVRTTTEAVVAAVRSELI